MYRGVRYRKQFVTEEEAQAWEAELKKRLRLGMPFQELLDAKDSKLRLSELLDKTFERYWRDTKNEAAQISNIKIITEAIGGDTPVEDIDTLVIDDFIASMERRGLAPATINNKLACLSKALTYALDRGYITNKPKIERKQVSNQRLRFLTDEEEYEILEALRADGRHEFALFFEWSIDTGIRPIESRHITQSAVRYDDNLGHLVDLRRTKNAYPRTIPLTDRAYNAYTELTDQFLPFARFNESNIRKHWRFVRSVMNDNDPEFVFYLTRHTCASRLVQRNVALHVVKEWMGHKKYEMTLRYAKLTPMNFLDAKLALQQVM